VTSSNPQTLGTVNGSPVVAELGGGLSPNELVTVTIGANAYVMNALPGYPQRPPAGAAAGPSTPPWTISSGATVQFLKPEADALIAAGWATLVGGE